MEFKIHNQYTKQIYFEAPNSPQAFLSRTKPNVSVNMNVKGRRLSDDMFESSLIVNFRAIAPIPDNEDENNDQQLEPDNDVDQDNDGLLCFSGNVNYTALVRVEDKDDETEAILMIEVPKLLFPFVRQIIVNLTTEAGFMPLLINNLDFKNFFEKNREEEEQRKLDDAFDNAG